MTVATKYNNPQIGCYFDGGYGQVYNDLRVIELAIGYGWQDNKADEISSLTEEQIKECEELSEMLPDIAQDAEDYMNELETRSYLSWQWNDGDFGLYPAVESAKEECEFVSDKLQDYPVKDYRGEWLHVSDHGNATLYVRESRTKGDFSQEFANWADGTTNLYKDTEIWSVV